MWITHSPMNRSLFAALLLLCSVQLLAQSTANSQFRISDWQSFTSQVNIRAVTLDAQEQVWAATSGGVFRADITTRTATEFRNINALISLDATAIAYSPTQNDVYVGTFDGVLEIYDLDSAKWTHIIDIKKSAQQYSRRTIRDIVFRGSLAYIATDFGVVIFDTERRVFVETIDRISDFQQKTTIHKVLLTNDSIIVAGQEGIAIAPLQTSTLRVPDVWKNLFPKERSDKEVFTSLAMIPSGLFVASEAKIYRRKENTDTLEVIQRTPASYLHFRSLSALGDTVFFTMEDRVARVNGNALTLTHPATINGHTFLQGKTDLYSIVYYETAGIGIVRDTLLNMFSPNTPLSNRIQDIAIDTAGNPWIVTSVRNSDGQGFSCLLGTRWRNYSAATTPFIKSDFYWRVNATADGSVWLANYGSGMLQGKAQKDTILFEHLTSLNSPLCPYPGDTKFTLAGDAISDRNGNTWFAHYGSDAPSCTNRLFMRDKSGTFNTFDFPDAPANTSKYLNIGIDASGTKWVGSPEGNGLMFFNERGTLTNTVDDKWGKFTIGDISLPDNQITALAVDKNGSVWIGSPSNGVAVIFNPSVVLNGSKPFVRKLTLLNSQSVNDIMIDALNNKWIATNSGVWVLNEDGTEVIGYINHDSYPSLLSDEIRCLATNENDGTVYIGTLQGLNAIKTLSLKPYEEFNLKVYPQPFNPHQDGELIIEGLEAETQIRIITVDGMLVRTIDTKSRRVAWNGKDENGNLVSNGVYVALIVSQANTRAIAAKIAVLYK